MNKDKIGTFYWRSSEAEGLEIHETTINLNDSHERNMLEAFRHYITPESAKIHGKVGVVRLKTEYSFEVEHPEDGQAHYTSLRGVKT